MPYVKELPPNHYYHLSTNLKVGDIIDTQSWEKNRYFEKKSELQWLKLINGLTPEEIYSAIINRSKTSILLQFPPIDIYKQSLQCTKDALIFIDEYVEFSRELIFEQVRLTINKNLPSRQQCIWLIDRDNIDDWKKFIDYDEIQLFTIELIDGQPFRAFQGHIKRQAETAELTFQRAKDYWEQKESTDSNLTEFLYEGKFKVVSCSNI